MRFVLIGNETNIKTSHKPEMFRISINSTFARVSLEEHIGFI